MTTMSRGADLQRLMAIAELYAHKLVAAGPPAMVLLIEHAGALDVTVLDGAVRDAAAEARRLLARHQATSAALLLETPGTPGEARDAVFCILGETVEGLTDERRYRVHPRSRRKRLTALTGGERREIEEILRPLFPIHLRPRATEDASTDAA
jgi:hypothetical protein